ncbi:4a-hydroxytetrahydrobiopterin dehydratase [Mariprofundus micogutta]|uniref:Putative pterin-4-alpha-carbinolamine dehydratase n=1 Tax=Mariprofundus micogutta TaxID=1921010 RepID=A0A1L8CQS5_9PROT|nr:4a-hydroxytetrahydrobiopterin dehydratase [Mariprofundus micogutta]GAV21247.1 4a-hydroxytetrahydrobiopterin dehydratase [Mariprofundus micogutta]
MTSDLHRKTCVPCQGGIAPMSREQAEVMMAQVPGWQLSENAGLIRRSFTFKNFMAAQQFATEVGNLSETENHHPDISYGWAYCTVTFYTHKIGGLHDNDFIMAAKVNCLK